MKNKNLHKVQSELINQLLDSVNSSEEFNYLKSLNFRGFSLLSQSDLVGNQLNKIKEI